jgi:hypothetical protein
MLLQGMVAGFIGPSPALSAVGIIVALVFAFFWLRNLLESER